MPIAHGCGESKSPWISAGTCCASDGRGERRASTLTTRRSATRRRSRATRPDASAISCRLADVVDCPPGQAVAPVIESYPAREAALPGGLVVRRALPRAGRRMVGRQLQDPFGHLWWVTTHKEDVAPE